jgi:hypothetical protein
MPVPELADRLDDGALEALLALRRARGAETGGVLLHERTAADGVGTDLARVVSVVGASTRGSSDAHVTRARGPVSRLVPPYEQRASHPEED